LIFQSGGQNLKQKIQFMKQGMMRKVLYALIPPVIAGIYFFGWRVLALLIVTTFFSCATEWIFIRKSTGKITEAVLVTSVLFTLTLPPATPYWVAAIGIVFGVLFGKMVFGGFGRNPFNPALVGRAFIYVNFPRYLTVEWTKAFSDFPGGLTHYAGSIADTVSQATPMLLFRSTGETLPLFQLILGNIGGSIGETSAVLIILAGIYLIYTKTASKEIMFSVIIGFLLLDSALYIAGFSQIPHPIYGLFSGGLLFASVFMATDPISSPKTTEAKIVYGLLIGFVTVIIRGFALFAGGVMFAILIGNTFAPIMDEAVKSLQAVRKSAHVGKEA
jgi:Na+-transporting NADH:ubiquinone oxidoreductase subunit B